MEEIYKGKVKSLFKTTNPDVLLMRHSDLATAFNAKKVENIPGKGSLNNLINAKAMRLLAENGIKNHFIKKINDTDCLVHKLTMLPVECIIRNYTAGSLVKRLDIEPQKKLSRPIIEFCYKNDSLGDPLINQDHMLVLGYATIEQINFMTATSLEVNKILSGWFLTAGYILADFKLEFGYNSEGELLLADEVTPDGCRIWRYDTLESVDKDIFRNDLGCLVSGYKEIAENLL